MLVLSRKIGERILIGDGVVVQVLAIRRGQIRIGISAPQSVHIRREELPRHPRPGEATSSTADHELEGDYHHADEQGRVALAH